MVLKEALLRNLYRGASIDDGVTTAMAVYVQREEAALVSQPLGDLREGRVHFGMPSPPDLVTA